MGKSSLMWVALALAGTGCVTEAPEAVADATAAARADGGRSDTGAQAPDGGALDGAAVDETDGGAAGAGGRGGDGGAGGGGGAGGDGGAGGVEEVPDQGVGGIGGEPVAGAGGEPVPPPVERWWETITDTPDTPETPEGERCGGAGPPTPLVTVAGLPVDPMASPTLVEVSGLVDAITPAAVEITLERGPTLTFTGPGVAGFDSAVGERVRVTHYVEDGWFPQRWVYVEDRNGLLLAAVESDQHFVPTVAQLPDRMHPFSFAVEFGFVGECAYQPYGAEGAYADCIEHHARVQVVSLSRTTAPPVLLGVDGQGATSAGPHTWDFTGWAYMIPNDTACGLDHPNGRFEFSAARRRLE